MSQLYGADVGQLRDLAGSFDLAAGRLDSGRLSVSHRIQVRAWMGPIAVRFRLTWDSQYSSALSHVAEDLRRAARELRTNADEQQRASTAEGGAASASAPASAGSGARQNGGNPFATWFVDRWHDVQTGTSRAADWVGDRAADVWNAGTTAVHWTGDRVGDALRMGESAANWVWDRAADAWSDTVRRVEAIGDSYANTIDAASQFWDATVGSLLGGRWPRTTEVAASALLLAGAAGGSVLMTQSLGEIGRNAYDDGDPVAGEPKRVEPPVQAPTDLTGVLGGVAEAYGRGDGSVRITTVDGPNGPRVIVDVPGTESWNPSAGSNPMDLTGNLVTAGGGRSTMSQAVELAMARAGIPAGAEVMLVGHSQGGMTVGDLVSDAAFVSRYHVTNAIAFGSPIDNDTTDPRVSVLSIQHASDIVPKLDTGGSQITPGGVTYGTGTPNSSQYHSVTLPDPSSPVDVARNHDYNQYMASVAASRDPALTAYQEQLRRAGFIAPGSETDSVDIKVGRRQ
jgi:hypothetical protein